MLREFQCFKSLRIYRPRNGLNWRWPRRCGSDDEPGLRAQKRCLRRMIVAVLTVRMLVVCIAGVYLHICRGLNWARIGINESTITSQYMLELLVSLAWSSCMCILFVQQVATKIWSSCLMISNVCENFIQLNCSRGCVLRSKNTVTKGYGYWLY